VLATARALTGPLVAFAIYNVVFIGWHFPSMYNWALVNHNAHILQHLMFIGRPC
jgi:cytochrome c oxidase assembly factor CtaG